MVHSYGFMVHSYGFMVHSYGFMVHSYGFMVHGYGFMVHGYGFGVSLFFSLRDSLTRAKIGRNVRMGLKAWFVGAS